MRRCGWEGDDPLMVRYHDEEWGVPERDDRRLFEFLLLEGAQAGLAWRTILAKREGYRRAFAGFDPEVVARYGAREVSLLLADPGIVRNRSKVEAAVENARALLSLRSAFGPFDRYLWGFVGGRPLVNRFGTLSDIPAETPESRALSRDLRSRGFRFVGPTTVYAFMQAVGMVNDHLLDCFRREQIIAVART